MSKTKLTYEEVVAILEEEATVEDEEDCLEELDFNDESYSDR